MEPKKQLLESEKEESFLSQEHEFQLPQELIDFAEKAKKNGTSKNYHVRVPVCLDKRDEKNKNKNDKSNLTAAQFKKCIEDIEKLELPYTLYLVPNDIDAYKNFLAVHAETINKIKDKDEDLNIDNKAVIPLEKLEAKKIVTISHWRQSAAVDAENAYKRLRFSHEHSTGVTQKMEESINAYVRNHNVDRKEVESHYLEETVDYISWMKRLDDPTPLCNILLYPYSLPQVIHNANMNAGYMGYVKDSLPHYKYELRKPQVKQSEQVTAQVSNKKQLNKKQKNSTQSMNEMMQQAAASFMLGPVEFALNSALQLIKLGALKQEEIPFFLANFYVSMQSVSSPAGKKEVFADVNPSANSTVVPVNINVKEAEVAQPSAATTPFNVKDESKSINCRGRVGLYKSEPAPARNSITRRSFDLDIADSLTMPSVGKVM